MKKLTILAMIALIGASCAEQTKPVNEIADNLSEIENQALYVDAVEAVQGEINYQLAYGCFRKLGSRRLQAAVDSVTSYVYKELFNNNKNILNELTTKAVTYESRNLDSMAIGRIMGVVRTRRNFSTEGLRKQDRYVIINGAEILQAV